MPHDAKHLPPAHEAFSRVVPYAGAGGLTGECVQFLARFDLASLPWDGPPRMFAETKGDPKPAGKIERVKRSHTRCVLTFEIPGPSGTTARVYVKQCRVRSARKRLASLLVACKARREWAAGREALRRGVPAAMPLLWAQRRCWGFQQENYLMTLGVEGGVAFADFWRGLESEGLRSLWLERLGRFVRQAHDRGVAHDDLNAKHILIAPGGAGSAGGSGAEFVLIDLDNARLMQRLGAYRRAHNFFQIFRSLPSRLLGQAERRIFLNAYSGGEWGERDLQAVERMIAGIAFIKRLGKLLRRG